MRYSRQREEILKVVRSTDTHPTADWIYAEVQKVLPQISLGTVYRNLNLLVEAGEISGFRDGTVIRYDGRKDKHHHFRCSQCGSLINVEVGDTRFLKSVREDYRVIIADFTIEFTGTCSRCLVGEKGKTVGRTTNE
ncbi:MAG: transcriptional repressor [Fidelibacterota bacterium]